ncbi:PKD repeat protein/N-acetylneuraminic acid mutarotase [Catalinimonas alkaloidigena]|uniref:Kelch repeat-containing protein n=1 Tax=Catalinimonas alkaloidigena TaxID=1075417 RepID=UPI0024055492|nr:PKD domain-containing protein [Catalinimonas alkaloidigena]MDF9796581.1 PKD repeat protein/N-acetylneuraminic acid mutarotase [Catalinimonas alkaloidigena]
MRTALLFTCGILLALVHCPLSSYAEPESKSASEYLFVPTINAGQEFNVVEGSPTGTVVGTVAATDAEGISQFAIIEAEALSTGVPPNDAPVNALALFDIDNNGTITVNDPTYLLAVVGPVILTIEVSNSQGDKATADVQINIDDAIVQPSLSQGLSWSAGTPQPLGNSEGQSEIVNGKLYSFSGFDIEKRPAYTPTERAYVYDPQTEAWTLLSPMPKMHPNSAHGGVTHAGFTTDGTDIYFAGGYAANANGNGQIFGTKYVYKYLVASDTYERLPDLPIARSAGGLEYIDGKLYYFGGTNVARTEDQGDLFVLDLNNMNGGWTNLTASPMPNPRNHLGSAVVDGKLYVVGGQHEQDGDLTTQDDVHRFDPATGIWTKVTDLPDIEEVPSNLSPGKGHITNSTFVYDGKIFVLGGEYKFLGPYSKSVMAYDPATDEWTRYSDMPTVRSSGIAGVVNGVLYYSTGRNSSTTYQATIGPPTTQEGVWLEAECGEVGSNWKEVSDEEASGGSYVVVPNLNSYSPPSDIAANRVRFSFSLEDGGDYHMFARLRAPSSGDDSFYIRVNGGSWVQWWQNITTGSSFNWNEVVGSPLSLNAGNNIIDIAYRENGAQLDKLHLNQSGFTPGGIGDDASNCDGNSGNKAPSAQFTADPESGQAPLSVNFDASDSYDDQGIVSYSWDFGDGNAGNGETVSHTYEEAGDYTVKLSVADAEGLKSETTMNVSVESPNTAQGIWLEAECGVLGSNWNEEASGEASGGNYVTIRPGLNSHGSAPNASNSHVSFSFTVEEAGTYQMHARVRAPTGSDDSFWVRIDGGNWSQWNIGPRTAVFAWRTVDVLSPDFSAGSSHTLDIAYREDGTDLDKLHISADGGTPTGTGEAATNCGGGSNQAPTANAGGDITVTDSDGNGSENVTLDASESFDNDGTITSYSWHVNGTEVAMGITASINVPVGTTICTLTVTDNQGATDTDEVTVTVNPASVGGSEIWLEAECGVLGSNWNEEASGEASGGSYVTIRPGLNSHGSAPDASNSHVSFTFTAEEAGTYQVHARVRAPSGSDDSFWVRIDGGNWFQWNIGPRTAVFAWRTIDVLPPNFSAGSSHTLDIAYREDGTDLDKLLISTDGNVPNGFGESATNCGGGTNQEAELTSINIFPNAMEESPYLNVHSTKEFGKTVSVTLLDQAGKTVMEHVRVTRATNTQLTLDFSEMPLAQGIYILRITENRNEPPQMIRFIKR